MIHLRCLHVRNSIDVCGTDKRMDISIFNLTNTREISRKIVFALQLYYLLIRNGNIYLKKLESSSLICKLSKMS